MGAVLVSILGAQNGVKMVTKMEPKTDHQIHHVLLILKWFHNGIHQKNNHVLEDYGLWKVFGRRVGSLRKAWGNASGTRGKWVGSVWKVCGKCVCGKCLGSAWEMCGKCAVWEAHLRGCGV